MAREIAVAVVNSPTLSPTTTASYLAAILLSPTLPLPRVSLWCHPQYVGDERASKRGKSIMTDAATTAPFHPPLGPPFPGGAYSQPCPGTTIGNGQLSTAPAATSPPSSAAPSQCLLADDLVPMSDNVAAWMNHQQTDEALLSLRGENTAEGTGAEPAAAAGLAGAEVAAMTRAATERGALSETCTSSAWTSAAVENSSGSGRSDRVGGDRPGIADGTRVGESGGASERGGGSTRNDRFRGKGISRGKTLRDAAKGVRENTRGAGEGSTLAAGGKGDVGGDGGSGGDSGSGNDNSGGNSSGGNSGDGKDAGSETETDGEHPADGVVGGARGIPAQPSSTTALESDSAVEGQASPRLPVSEGDTARPGNESAPLPPPPAVVGDLPNSEKKGVSPPHGLPASGPTTTTTPPPPPQKFQPEKRKNDSHREGAATKAVVSGNSGGGGGGGEGMKMGKATAMVESERGRGTPIGVERFRRNRMPVACSPNVMGLPAAGASTPASGVLSGNGRIILKSFSGERGGGGGGIGGSGGGDGGKQVSRHAVVGLSDSNKRRSGSSGSSSGSGGSGSGSSCAKLRLREGCGSELVGRHCVGAKCKLDAQRDGGNMEYTSA